MHATVHKKKKNIGECDDAEPMKSHRRACLNYQQCGYKIPREQLIEEYDGECGTVLHWICPVCDTHNLITYKVTKTKAPRRKFGPTGLFNEGEKLKLPRGTGLPDSSRPDFPLIKNPITAEL